MTSPPAWELGVVRSPTESTHPMTRRGTLVPRSLRCRRLVGETDPVRPCSNRRPQRSLRRHRIDRERTSIVETDVQPSFGEVGTPYEFEFGSRRGLCAAPVLPFEWQWFRPPAITTDGKLTGTPYGGTFSFWVATDDNGACEPGLSDPVDVALASSR